MYSEEAPGHTYLVYFIKIPGIADIPNDTAQQATGLISASSLEFTQISITENASNKQTNKMTSAALLRERNGVSVDVSSLFEATGCYCYNEFVMM